MPVMMVFMLRVMLLIVLRLMLIVLLTLFFMELSLSAVVVGVSMLNGMSGCFGLHGSQLPLLKSNLLLINIQLSIKEIILDEILK
jgi:hypothetical protein